MAKRSRLEIIKDILLILQNNRNAMRPTPLLRRSNLSTTRFKEYFIEMKKKGFVEVSKEDGMVILTETGMRFLEKYKTIVDFIDEFGL